ncbi:TetR/AcrR family transcriptional regulator [Lactobacillaceae bacterium Melli_B4]
MMINSNTKIIDAYLQLAQTRSFLDINNDMIIKAAHVSKSTFYSYFNDQADLVVALQKMVDKSILKPINRRLAQYPDREISNSIQYQTIIAEDFVPFLNQNRDLVRKLGHCDFNYLWETRFFQRIDQLIRPMTTKKKRNQLEELIRYTIIILAVLVSELSLSDEQLKQRFKTLMNQRIDEIILM